MLTISIILLLIILSSFFIIFSRNTIVSMLALIWCFLLTGSIFLLLGADFLAFTIIIVYGSAISILFLFVVMLLNLRTAEIYHLNYSYLPLAIFIAIALVVISNSFLSKNIPVFFFNELIVDNNTFVWLNFFSLVNYRNNLFNFGIVLYNHYWLFVITSGLILLVAMLGAIILVLKDNTTTCNNSSINYSTTKKKCIIKNFTIKKKN